MFYKELTQLGENFEQSKRDLERGYPITLVQEILTEVKFTGRNETLRNKTKQTKEILPFVNTYNPATPNRKNILMKQWDIIQQQPISFKHIFNQPTIVFYRKEKSLKDILVSAKIPSISQQSQNQRSG